MTTELRPFPRESRPHRRTVQDGGSDDVNRKDGPSGAASPDAANAYDSEVRVTQGADVAALLALSGERDLWAARLLAEWQRGYQAGYADAVRDAEQRANAEWRPRVLPVAEGPSHAELDRRRYPPGGRTSWRRSDAFTAPFPVSGAA